MDGYRLGVDFGTSNTVAVLSWPDGHVRPLLFDGSPLLPSAVCAQPTGELLVGRDALHAARAVPGSFEPYPKRRVDEGTVLLGDVEIAVADLFAAVFARVLAEVDRVARARPAEVVLTHPASWGSSRRDLLASSAAAAGMDRIRLVAEPVAAAAYLVEVAGARLPVGTSAVVYDFGAGTFDATVVRRGADGYEVLATRGLDDTGGLDVDAAIVAHLDAVYRASRPEPWRRLAAPATPTDRRAAWQMWEDVRTAKETLSRLGSTLVHLPILDEDAPIGREQLESVARPVVDRTVEATRAAIQAAGLTPAGIAGVFLVGGASRLPLAATVLHRALGLAAFVTEQPELVVAEGSLHARAELPRVAAPPPAAQLPVATPPAPSTTAISRSRSWKRRGLVAAGALAAIAVTVLAVVLPNNDNTNPTDTPSTGVAADSITLGFVQPGNESTWRVAQTRSIQEAAGAAGITVEVADGQQLQRNQIDAIRRYIANRVDVIAFSPVVVSGWDTVLAEARTAGIPVILVDRAVETADTSLFRSVIGSNFEQEGRRAGEWLVRAYGARPGPVNIVELRGTPSEPADDRQRGFAGAISADPKFRIVAAPSAEFTRHKGEQVMGAILAANRGIHVVYAHNDDMGIGALRAIEKAGLAPGRDIQIITIDGTRDALTALAGGKLNFVVECSPHLGPQLIDLVKKVHAGGPVERRVWTEETTFDQRQAAEALPRRQY